MNISVLGCGWLGLPLAKEIINKGHVVNGSTTSREKIPELAAGGIIPYQIKLFEEGIQGDIASFLNEAEVLVIDVPPGLRKDPSTNFIAKMGRLKDHMDRASLKHIILVSSTSVFEDKKEIPVYTEDDPPNGTLPNSEQLIGVEKLMLSGDVKTSIVRFGGLIGPGRHPVNFLSGRKNIMDPNGPVNLIHLDDCIGLITAIIDSDTCGIFHGVNPEHPSKEKYYKSVAVDKNLAIPEFDEVTPSKGKIITSMRMEEELGFAFTRKLMV